MIVQNLTSNDRTVATVIESATKGLRHLQQSSVTKQSEAQLHEIISIFGKIHPFQKVRTPLLHEISAHCSIRSYHALQVVAMEGADISDTDGFLVLSGRVAMLKTSVNGRELEVQLVTPQSIFGLVWCLYSDTSELTARIQVASRLLHIPKSCLLYLLGEMPNLYPDFLSEFSHRLSYLHDMARSLAHDPVEVRIAATLFAILQQKHKSGDGFASGDLRVSRQEIANICGTTVETAIRVTRSFEQSGMLAFPRHGIIRVLDTESLRMVAGGESAQL